MGSLKSGKETYRYVPGHTEITCDKLQLGEAGLEWIQSILTKYEVHMILDNPFFSLSVGNR